MGNVRHTSYLDIERLPIRCFVENRRIRSRLSQDSFTSMSSTRSTQHRVLLSTILCVLVLANFWDLNGTAVLVTALPMEPLLKKKNPVLRADDHSTPHPFVLCEADHAHATTEVKYINKMFCIGYLTSYTPLCIVNASSPDDKK